MRLEYYTLLNGVGIDASTDITYSLLNNRKFSDYKGDLMILFKPSNSEYVRPAGRFPINYFNTNLFCKIEGTFFAGGSTQWVDIEKKSDTSVRVKSSYAGNVFLLASVVAKN